MRVLATSSAALSRESAAARRVPGPVFSLPEGAEGLRRSAPAQLRAVGGIDSLVALQGVEDATEKRRRAVRKGKGALDALDAVKVGLLAGTLDQATINRLQAAAEGLAEATGEAGLDAVLSGIDLRLQVEIAKLTRP